VGVAPPCLVAELAQPGGHVPDGEARVRGEDGVDVEAVARGDLDERRVAGLPPGTDVLATGLVRPAQRVGGLLVQAVQRVAVHVVPHLGLVDVARAALLGVPEHLVGHLQCKQKKKVHQPRSIGSGVVKLAGVVGCAWRGRRSSASMQPSRSGKLSSYPISPGIRTGQAVHSFHCGRARESRLLVRRPNCQKRAHMARTGTRETGGNSTQATDSERRGRPCMPICI
jgi:hypothetical protein